MEQKWNNIYLFILYLIINVYHLYINVHDFFTNQSFKITQSQSKAGPAG